MIANGYISSLKMESVYTIILPLPSAAPSKVDFLVLHVHKDNSHGTSLTLYYKFTINMVQKSHMPNLWLNKYGFKNVTSYLKYITVRILDIVCTSSVLLLIMTLQVKRLRAYPKICKVFS